MKTLTTLCAALALSGLAFAADEKPVAPNAPTTPDAPATTAAGGEKKKHNPEEAFAKLDTNSDKSISMDEFKAGPMAKKDPTKADEVFKRKDKDNDGKLSLEEFSAHGPKGEKKNK